jgi:hypothetical protein
VGSANEVFSRKAQRAKHCRVSKSFLYGLASLREKHVGTTGYISPSSVPDLDIQKFEKNLLTVVHHGYSMPRTPKP